MIDERNITNTANITDIRKIIDCKFSVIFFLKTTLKNNNSVGEKPLIKTHFAIF